MTYNINKARYGESNANSVLTDEKVKAMREAWIPKGPGKRKHKGPSIMALAKANGVSYGTAWHVLQGHTWWKV